MRKNAVLKMIIEAADQLDYMGFHKQSSVLDGIVEKLAAVVERTIDEDIEKLINAYKSLISSLEFIMSSAYSKTQRFDTFLNSTVIPIIASKKKQVEEHPELKSSFSALEALRDFFSKERRKYYIERRVKERKRSPEELLKGSLEDARQTGLEREVSELSSKLKPWEERLEPGKWQQAIEEATRARKESKASVLKAVIMTKHV